MSSRVVGILLMGTTGTNRLSPHSDYDVLLVLRATPTRLRMVNTWIDGRLAEIYITEAAVLEALAPPSRIHDATERGAIASWLAEGQIAYDPESLLARAQRAVRTNPPALPDDMDLYLAWLGTGYTIQHTRRYLESGDKVALAAVDLRMLFSLDDLKGHYFLVRRVPWRGFKEAVRYWQQRDPGWLEDFLACVREQDRERKFERYVELANLTFESVGDFWKRGETVVDPRSPFGTLGGDGSPGSVDAAMELWDHLCGP